MNARFLTTATLAVSILSACTTSPKPLELTYPHAWVDYGLIENLRKIATRASPYFVKVFVYDAYDLVEAVGVGSGTVIDEIGHVITAAHIVKGDENRAFVKNMNGSTLPAEIIHVDPDSELALLRTTSRYEAISMPPETTKPESGQKAFAIGTLPAYDPVVSAGVVRSYLPGKQFRSGHYGFDSPIVLDMHVDTGYSGGPVFDAEGKLLGMVVGFDGEGSGQEASEQILTTFALPASKLYEFYYQWR